MKKALLLFLFCGSCYTPTQAEQAAFAVIAPAHIAYVEADSKLSAKQKRRRLDLIETWRVAVGAKK